MPFTSLDNFTSKSTSSSCKDACMQCGGKEGRGEEKRREDEEIQGRGETTIAITDT